MRPSTIATAITTFALAGPACAGWFGLSDTGSEADAKTVGAQARTFAAAQEEWLRPFALALYRDGEWGAVLNLDRLGLAAMEQSRLPLARKAFDEAIARVESIYADDANAAKARSVFNQEKVKDFKGEPYERAMMYYYRGVLYAHEGDYQNARAAFLAADRHDTLSSAESQSFVGNFGMMKYLAAWASQCEGEAARAQQLVQEARQADTKMLSLPEMPPTALILVDAGKGPQKWGDGKYQEILRFKAVDEEQPVLQLKVGDKAVAAGPSVLGDVNFQATTRGGREIDGIMSGKARFKESAGDVGNASLAIGQEMAMAGALSGNNDMANMGLIGMFAGLVAKGVEQATTPAADVRGWDSLPAKVLVFAGNDLAAEQGPQLVARGGTRTLPMAQRSGHCAIAWGRTDSALAESAGGTARFIEQAPTESNRGERNKRFRTMLADELLARELVATK